MHRIVGPSWKNRRVRVLVEVDDGDESIPPASFEFVDLFAGVGGFHAALAQFGGTLRMAVEIDAAAQTTYKRNWGHDPERDVVEMARERIDEIGPHAVLAGGFPCQPFSKSGRQLGMAEERGQMFDEIVRILKAYRPPVVMLENVRNLTGPRQQGMWQHVVTSLRAAGYRVPSRPLVVSPHRLPRELGGAPQTRERVYILGTYVGRARAQRETDLEPLDIYSQAASWDPSSWILDDFLEPEGEATAGYGVTPDEAAWLDTWQDFLLRTAGIPLPGHPLWSDLWRPEAVVDRRAPEWKREFELKNLRFYASNRRTLDAWRRSQPQLASFPPSRRKFEWQAQDLERDIFRCLIHLRPSGIRVKKPTYAPALVAMAQTPIVGSRRRRMTPRETARLQNFPETFEFDHQPDSLSYKQLGNAINVGVASRVFAEHVRRDAADIAASPAGAGLVVAVLNSAARGLELNPAHRQ